MQYGETWLSCAIREVYEETGLNINQDKFSKVLKIKSTSMYFFLDMEECNVDIQHTISDNDANGIGWIKIECLFELINNGFIKINKHCEIK